MQVKTPTFESPESTFENNENAAVLSVPCGETDVSDSRQRGSLTPVRPSLRSLLMHHMLQSSVSDPKGSRLSSAVYMATRRACQACQVERIAYKELIQIGNVLESTL